MIFINYRNEDTAPHITFISKELEQRYGKENVFFDDTTIRVGEKWPDALQKGLENCSLLLAFIGAAWGDVRYKSGEDEGRFRLDDENDWVRREICEAIRLKKTIIVVRIDDVSLPKRKLRCVLDELPNFQNIPLRIKRYFEKDFEDLCEAIEKAAPHLKKLPNATPTETVNGLEPETGDPDYTLNAVWLEQQSHLKAFVGREMALADISAWIDKHNAGKYLLMKGPPGQGKSALMAKLADQEGRRGGCLLHMVKCHSQTRVFVPALISQAAKLCQRTFGLKFYSGDLNDLRNNLVEALDVVHKKFGRAVVVLDALDEMEGEGSDGSFLPHILPAGVRVVMTCRPTGKLVNDLKARLGSNLDVEDLEPFSPGRFGAIR